MTSIIFHSEGERIVGFDSCGHSGYAEAGEDIVCAAITSAIRLVEATINDVLGLAATVKVDQEAVKISLHLPGGLSHEADYACQSLMTGLLVYLAELHEEYPNFVEVLEEGDDDDID